MVTQDLVKKLKAGLYDAKLKDIYVDEKKISYERSRYIKAVESYTVHFGEGEVSVFSAPGRSEIGGNHTDHQCGEVLAASINNDAIAIVQKLKEPCVKVISDGYELITIDLDDLDRREDEAVTTNALIRGVLAKTKEYGYQIGGFQAFVTSDVLIGAGLSSSAAFETLMGTILSYLFNDGKISPIEIAMIGQFAENVYFGKPCGLMDQMACSVGSLAHINFQNPTAPFVERIEFDLDAQGYSLCITDTKGSHADLTAEYAAIPEEMKDMILEAAMQAPTAGCQQLYTILDITDQNLKEALAESCDHQPFIAKAPMVLVFCADCKKWYDAYLEAGCKPRKPDVGDLMLAVTDTAIAAQNAVVAAESFGIGSCYIGDIMEITDSSNN